MKVATLNVNSLIRNERKAWLKSTIFAENIDIICLQETKISSIEQEVEFVHTFKEQFYVFHACGSGGSAGTAVMVKKCSKIAVIDCELEQNGRVACVDFMWNGDIIRVMSIYAPNECAERKLFFESSVSHFAATDGKVILAGDFNCVIRKEDRSCRKGFKDSSVRELKRLLRDNDLEDIALGKDDTSVHFTHWQGASHARLDRIYVSSEMLKENVQYKVTPLAFTDHGLVAALLTTDKRRDNRRRQTAWKMNDSILEDEKFREKVKGMLANLKETGTSGPAWESFKEKVRLECIERSEIKKAEKKKEVAVLTQSLLSAVREEERSPGLFGNDIKEIKNKILEQMRNRFRGAQVRSRLQSIERDEVPTKVFRVRERERVKANTISKIVTDGTMNEGPERVEAALFKHYQKLFMEEDCARAVCPELFKQVPQLTDEDREKAGRQVTQAEIRSVIRKLPRNKAPGPDGISAAFYKTFHEELCPILESVYEDIRSRGLMTPSMRKSYTVLIPKGSLEGRTPTPSDLRPISLLCTDYKILAKVLARRMDSLLWRVIGKHQAYGIKKRSISANLHIMRSACESVKAAGSQLTILQADMSQAFDRVRHKFLFDVLRWVGVGDDIEQWVQICYREISAQLIINGNLGPRFAVTKSVRQGCPMSPTLFSLYLEPLCRLIVTSSEVRGLKLAKEEVKVLAFADDVAVFCLDKDELKHVLGVAQDFCRASGAKLNQQKSRVACLGEQQRRPASLMGIDCSDDLGKYLGVYLDTAISAREMWKSKLNSLQGKIQPYKGRELSVLHRSFICNTVLYPAVLYPAQAIPIDAATIQRFHRTCATFLWKSTFERMRRTNLFWSLEAGGLNMVNLEIKLKVHRFLYFRDEGRAELRAAIQTLGAKHLLQWIVTTDARALSSPSVEFYKEVAASIKFFEEKFSWDYLMAVRKKTLYWDTVTSMFPAPLYRQKYSSVTPRDALKRVRKLPLPTGSKDFFVRFHLEVLPVKVWLEGKGFFAPFPPNCDVCGEKETIRHVVHECRNALLFWSDLSATFEVNEEITYENLKFLNFGESSGNEATCVLAVAGLQALWRARTARVEREPKTVSPVLYMKTKLLWTLSLLGTGRLRDEERWKGLAPTIRCLDPLMFGRRGR